MEGPKRFHVRAWGHETAPDLDYETDEDDREWLYRHYPCISVALQIPVTYEDIMRELNRNAPLERP